MKTNRQEWEQAAEAFMAWVKGGGKELPGLVKRRKAEKALFLS
jgi:lysozyme